MTAIIGYLIREMKGKPLVNSTFDTPIYEETKAVTETDPSKNMNEDTTRWQAIVEPEEVETDEDEENDDEDEWEEDEEDDEEDEDEEEE